MKKVKVMNPNSFKVGLNFMDGIKSTIVPPKGYVSIPEEEVDYINSTSSIFRRKILIIDEPEKNQDLGYAEKTLANYTDEEIVELIKGHLNKTKAVLEKEKERHVIDRVISLARSIDELSINKIEYLEKWSGYQFRLNSENDND